MRHKQYNQGEKTMNVQATYGTSGSKFGKIAIVGALHIAFGLAMINMKASHTAAPDKPIIDLFTPVPDAPPIDPPDTTPLPTKLEQPDLPTVPTPIVETTPVEDTIRVKVSDVIPPPPVIREKGGTETGTVTEQVKPAVEVPGPLSMTSDCVLPHYPPASARNGDEGTVTLALLIDTNGTVSSAKIAQSSGYRELDRAALNALSLCSFKPAMANGVAQSAWGRIAYVWRLD
jgi:protein TonB